MRCWERDYAFFLDLMTKTEAITATTTAAPIITYSVGNSLSASSYGSSVSPYMIMSFDAATGVPLTNMVRELSLVSGERALTFIE